VYIIGPAEFLKRLPKVWDSLCRIPLTFPKEEEIYYRVIWVSATFRYAERMQTQTARPHRGRSDKCCHVNADIGNKIFRIKGHVITKERAKLYNDVKVKLFLCLTEYHAVKMYGGVEV
jgi:hypothetical protein